ncbi:MAG TPA: phenylalanine--tRNA ligase subunit alpha, partial [Chloroflexota bacterium]|nr:phenylalanine--tRNA ligase subunit alpha [Chloroflexota bacterium]
MPTSMNLIDELDRLEQQASAELPHLTTDTSLDEWRVRILGRNGSLAGLLRSLGTLAADERPRAGAAANRAKTALEAAFSERQRTLRAASRIQALEAERIDVTLPARG